jgi:Predicted membrane protein
MNESKEQSMRESKFRSFLKALTWRVVATTTIFIIAYLTGGDLDMAITIASIEFFVKFALYYLHERAWQMAPRGSIRKIFSRQK